MQPFAYLRPASRDDAAARLLEPGAVPIGGGTDLLVTWKEGLVAPGVVVDVGTLDADEAVAEGADGSLRLAGSARIADLAAHPVVRARARALAEACLSVGTPQLRAMGTLGGNLCQRPRCWYFRRGVRCLKNGGTDCPAVEGEHQYHAILGGGPCWIVHPSDPAVALVALEATVVLRRGSDVRHLPIEEFYLLPAERLDHETALTGGEFVEAVEIPAVALGGEQRYEKVMQRGAWDFAVVSLASVKRGDGDVRLALGGVAPVPWRVAHSVEEDVASGGLDDDAIDALSERALYDARPLARNGYKVTIAQGLLRRAMRELGA